MALYLGNQKVSLRSGQDPTFDYGFDSNGRLVFANKNATEINNFLNYDSSYAETLDLSNLSKMEKVAVNGTADRKMEGLKGLLVSPNAPFTGSSPQINASYTGLSKSALVSLFESVPYNVGYTKVGNPTIVDGVASGFSASDYLKINNNFSSSSNFEIVVRGTAIYAAAQRACLVFNNGEKGFLDIGSDSPGIRLALKYNGSLTSFRIYPNLIEGQLYYIHIIKTNSTLTLGYSTDGKNILLSEDFSLTSFDWIFSYILLGIAPWQSATSYGGSIDLNETYIKVNGVPWFTGKAAMTKTCSIVGAAGTADITQEDKNIILNKGWNLTIQ